MNKTTHYLTVIAVSCEASHDVLGCIEAVEGAIKPRMPDGSKFSASLWRVPGNMHSKYRLNNWEPEVQGAVKLFPETGHLKKCQ